LGIDSARSVSAALDRFFEQYYARRPVNATFTGVHEHDATLPDWSLDGLTAQRAEMRALHDELTAAHPAPDADARYRDHPDLLDAELARTFLEIQLAEDAGMHGVRGNPALWSGEAVFSVISLMIREFAPLAERIDAATARLEALPAFLADIAETTRDRRFPASWKARALRDCQGAELLLTGGIDRWLASADSAPSQAQRLRCAAHSARQAVERFVETVRSHDEAPDDAASCGPELYGLLLRRGHQCTRSRAELLVEARKQLRDEQRRLDAMTRELGPTWSDVQGRLAGDHDYLATFTRTWNACRATVTEHGAVTWPDWPLRYTTIPEFTRDAAPYLYYLYYRSPAPFDAYHVYDYVVPALPELNAEPQLRTWNNSVIKLNHVVHHGAVGHHVQNWHAYHRASSRVAKIAAVDCANRIGMFCGGTMAEGWACYATQLMDELGFLSPLERISEQHSRVRFLARAIVDIGFHEGSLSFDEAIAFFATEARMEPAVARAETVKCSMFPGTALMYWLGTQTILDLREQRRRARGPSFNLHEFHDELLGYGSIPVPLVSRLMLAGSA
jgi:uncharacterized protein (DUF885 family)